MTANYDNTAAAIPGVIRDAASGVPMLVTTDGSLYFVYSGTNNVAAGAAATTQAWIPGTIRDPVSGTPLKVNADGSINVANA